MRILTRLNLLSFGMVLAMTASVLITSSFILDEILFRVEERVLKLELDNAKHGLLETLNRSGLLATTQHAATLRQHIQQTEHRPSANLYIVDAALNRMIYHPTMKAGTVTKSDFGDQMLARKEGVIRYEFEKEPRIGRIHHGRHD